MGVNSGHCSRLVHICVRLCHSLAVIVSPSSSLTRQPESPEETVGTNGGCFFPQLDMVSVPETILIAAATPTQSIRSLPMEQKPYTVPHLSIWLPWQTASQDKIAIPAFGIEAMAAISPSFHYAYQESLSRTSSCRLTRRRKLSRKSVKKCAGSQPFLHYRNCLLSERLPLAISSSNLLLVKTITTAHCT